MEELISLGESSISPNCLQPLWNPKTEAKAPASLLLRPL